LKVRTKSFDSITNATNVLLALTIWQSRFVNPRSNGKRITVLHVREKMHH